VYLGRRNAQADRFVGLSTEVMKTLQQIMNEILSKIEGKRRTQYTVTKFK
jgi:hypothetical protein